MTTPHMSSGRSRMQTYRQWVEEGARGSFLTPSVAVNAVRLINPLDRGGGYFVRRDTSAPDQQERRAQLALTDQNDGEREDRHTLARYRHSHPHVYDYANEPVPLAGTLADGGTHSQRGPSPSASPSAWVVTARVERPAEVVRRGWLGWETLGEVVLPGQLPSQQTAQRRDEQKGELHHGEG